MFRASLPAESTQRFLPVRVKHLKAFVLRRNLKTSCPLPDCLYGAKPKCNSLWAKLGVIYCALCTSRCHSLWFASPLLLGRAPSCSGTLRTQQAPASPSWNS